MVIRCPGEPEADANNTSLVDSSRRRSHYELNDALRSRYSTMKFCCLLPSRRANSDDLSRE